jgi:iron(III) transport system ATP-binding protein
VAQFVGEAMLLRGHADGGQVTCALGRLAVAGPDVEGPVDVMIRPEQVRFHALDMLGGAAGNAIIARVVDHAYFGPDTVVHLSLEGSPQLSVKARTFDHELPAVGERVATAVRGPVVVFAGAQ